MATYNDFNGIFNAIASMNPSYMDINGRVVNYVKVVGDMVYEMQNNRPTPEQLKKIDDFLDL